MSQHGYRNVYYNNYNSEITLWKWNSVGDRVEEKFHFKPYIYIESQNKVDATSIYNTNLKKLEFENNLERRNYVKKCGIKRIFYNIPAEQQALIDYYGNANENLSFSKFPLKIFYLDLETDSPGAFPIPELANDPINAITIYDSLNDQYHTWGLLNDYNIKRPNHRYYKCFSEEDLLKAFLKFWRRDYPDLVTGWNSSNFDQPYLINRITKILGEDEAKTISPVNRIFKQENVLKNTGGYGIKWHVKGISFIDYLDAYKTFSREKRESYSLNNIAEVELGEGKLAYNATSLSQLSKTNWDQFIDYNVKDVELLIQLEEKLQFIKFIRSLGYLGLTPFEASLGTIAIVTGAMALEALKRNKIIATFEGQKSDYPGGFVKEPEPGLYDDIVTFDVNSLYPNTIITLNLSPETKLGKILSRENGMVKFKLINGKEYEVSEVKFKKFIELEKIAISCSDIMFSQKERGICAQLVDNIYQKRLINKKEMKFLKKEMEKHKKGTQIYKNLSTKYEQLDMWQFSSGKILLNRIYGTYANKHSPFCDTDLASSITLTGQAIIKETENVINKHIKEKYDIDENCVKYSDTDSCFLTIFPILKKLSIPLIENGSVSQRAFDITIEINDLINKEINKWSKDYLNTIDSRYEFKKEAICDSALLIRKKRYILHLIDEGDEKQSPCEKLKPVGVQIRSTATPKNVKPFLERLIRKLMLSKNQKETDKEYCDIYEEFKKMKIEDLSVSTSIKGLNKYASQSNELKTVKGTPLHVKSAIYYNNLLEKLNLTSKYEKIESGNKIKLFYVMPNKYGISSIAYSVEYPQEFGLKMDIDKMFNKLITKELERFYEVVKWELKDPSMQRNGNLQLMFGF